MVTQRRELGDSCHNGNNSYHNNSNNNNNNSKNYSAFCIEERKRDAINYEITNQTNFSIIRMALLGLCILLAMNNAIVTVLGAAVYSNINFLTNPNFEQICSVQQEHFIESDGKESSLILEFTPGATADQRKLCTRILSAPSNYGFIVRLILPKIRRNRHGATAATAAGSELAGASVSNAVGMTSTTTVTAMANVSTTVAGADEVKGNGALPFNEMTSVIEKLNATTIKGRKPIRSCPLTIFSSLDPHTPQWRLDPCLLEDTAPEIEDPVRLFHGRVRIVWQHDGHTLHSKLMVTALGKGEQCRRENKHQCLRIGDEPILCISNELVCDGIRHCPISNEYDSDEDYEMCWKRRRYGDPIPPAMETDIFEHFALEVFRNLFAFDVPTYTETTALPSTVTALTSEQESSSSGAVNSTTLRKVDTKQMEQSVNDTVSGGSRNATPTMQTEHTSESTVSHHRRNSTRSGLNSDLSKYGPWGYLMLGMLLCGGALLICGLWASASQHAANNEREAALQSGVSGAGNDLHSTSTAPPNYEELDPPPAYSVLFPNQKAASSTTLSSLGAAALAPPTMAAVALTTPNGIPAVMAAGTPTSTTPPTRTSIAVAVHSADALTTTAAAAAAATTTTTISRVYLENAASSSQAH